MHSSPGIIEWMIALFGFSLRPMRRSKQPMQRQPPYGSMTAAFHTEFFVG